MLTLLTACNSKSSAEELTKELEKVSSWAATAHMVGEAWIRGDVPMTYAKQTLKTTQKEVQKETDKLSKSSIPQRQNVLKPLQRLQNTIGQMSTAVEQKDRTAIATQLKQLSTEEKTIRSLAKPADEKS